MQYLALLRGINVGGNNIIKMITLRTCFEKAGFRNVLTFIQSGNVLFESAEKNIPSLANKIEKMLSREFNYNSRVVLVSQNELAHTVTHAPKRFGSQPMKYRYDVIFLKSPLAAKEAVKSIVIKKGVDRAFAGKNVLYFSRLIAKATQSRLSKIIQLPMYQNMTIRNWNTTTMLFSLMTARTKK